jgi:hypothetical protein
VDSQKMSGETIVIKGVNKKAYRKLKSKAAKEGMTMGQAASRAFMDWAIEEGEHSPLSYRIRDSGRMQAASLIMDKIRSKQKIEKDWSSERVIREWRDRRTS